MRVCQFRHDRLFSVLFMSLHSMDRQDNRRVREISQLKISISRYLNSSQKNSDLNVAEQCSPRRTRVARIKSHTQSAESAQWEAGAAWSAMEPAQPIPHAAMRETIRERHASACRYKNAIPGGSRRYARRTHFRPREVYQEQQPNFLYRRELRLDAYFRKYHDVGNIVMVLANRESSQ